MKTFIRTSIAIALLLTSLYAQGDVPFTFVNNSPFPDDQVYVAIIGITGGHVWIDATTGKINEMKQTDNTLQVPNGGALGPGNKGLYANCFTQLSKIPGKKVTIPAIAGSRILISFGSPLYIYFFGYSGAPSGYAAPNLANPADPNQGIRFEMIELTNGNIGIWTNTTRVDSYQYPMGLEVWGGDGFYKKTGELLKQDAIIAEWKKSIAPAFQGCLNEAKGVIMAPSKTSVFQKGGAQADYFKPYVDAIWEKYKNEDLIFSSGDAGVWKGRVINERFEFHNLTNMHGNATAYISRRPTTQEVLEGSGALAEDVQKLSTQTLDLVVQAQFCAALNRHAIDLTSPAGVTQAWSDSSKYFKTAPYNEYVKFWHRADVSWNQSSYGFCYDDVFDYSSTIHAQKPTNATITVGGFGKDIIVDPIKDPVALLGRQCAAPNATLLRIDASHSRIYGNQIESGQLSVYDTQAHLIATKPYTAGFAQLNAPLTGGVYLWKLESLQGHKAGRIVVNR